MRTNLPADLWLRVKFGATDECWPWLGGCRPNGYGSISVDGRGLSTHRLAYELTNGPVPEGMFVCHSCDNPPCCNPAHLFLGTASDNTRDMYAKGRCPVRRGSAHHNAKLSEAAVVAIRRRRGKGERATDLAAEFGVSKPTITRVVKSEGWLHV